MKYNFKKIGLFWLVALMIIVGSVMGIALKGSDYKSGVWASNYIIPAKVGKSFVYNFDEDGIIEQASSMKKSGNSYWWLSSGGELIKKGCFGLTLHGEQKVGSKLYKRYYKYNRVNSDGGLHPQNIFRLVTRSKWNNSSQQVYAKIDELNLSSSPGRNASNGILFFIRYRDQHSLYYAGIRVDGKAVIKKKINGSYYTLAYEPLFEKNKSSYDKYTNPNLLPVHKWIGIKSVTKTLSNGDVEIKFYIDKDLSGQWELAAKAIDDGSIGGKPIIKSGHAGVRSDFMDIKLEDYKIEEL